MVDKKIAVTQLVKDDKKQTRQHNLISQIASIESQPKGKDGILEAEVGIVGGHKTIFERLQEESGEDEPDDVEVIDDYGARGQSEVHK